MRLETFEEPSAWGAFWDVIWWFLAAFIFIAYLFVLFGIISDLFRDRELSGWVKALWIVFLIFVPFLTALIYLIARGSGMSERGGWGAEAHQSAYVRSVAGGGASPAEEIAKAKALRDAAVISDVEYEAIKAKALR